MGKITKETSTVQKAETPLEQDRAKSVPWYGYVSLILAIIFFSGIFANAEGWLKVFDFTALLGQFGALQGPNSAAATFTGSSGIGARDGFLFALSLAPSVMLALGIVEIVTYLQGLRAAEKLLTPLLRPLLGIPGITGLALISSLQSTDAGASMTRELRDNDMITDRERLLFCAFQLSADGIITNYLATGAALFSLMTVPIITPLIVMCVFKVFGTNLMRLYLKRIPEEAINK